MRTKVTQRGQVSITPQIRKKLKIDPETELERAVKNATVRVIPLPSDPIRAFRGSGKKGMVKRLLGDRRQDRQREDAS